MPNSHTIKLITSQTLSSFAISLPSFKAIPMPLGLLSVAVQPGCGNVVIRTSILHGPYLEYGKFRIPANNKHISVPISLPQNKSNINAVLVFLYVYLLILSASIITTFLGSRAFITETCTYQKKKNCSLTHPISSYDNRDRLGNIQ